MDIKALQKKDWNQLASIYKEGLDIGIATFETQVPSWEQWDAAHHNFARVGAFQNNKLIGWAALSPVSKRAVYKGVAEVSIYLTAEARGHGLAKKILLELVKQSEENQIWTLQSSIFRENRASIALHFSCGFRQIGFREKIAQRNGIWYDNILMERRSLFL